MHQLEAIFRAAIATHLVRSQVTKCSTWAETYRVMGEPIAGKWTFRYHPWLRQVHDDDTVKIYVRKAAQVGFTECALNKALYAIDMHNLSVLYLLPDWSPGASDFSAGRFDPALELSEHLKGLFTDTANVGHKRAGSANLYIRGSRSRAQLKSIPVARLICDEYDEMEPDNVALAEERTSGQRQRQIFNLSTPHLPDEGIDFHYQTTTQNHFTFPCPSCDKYIELNWPENVVLTASHINDPSLTDTHYICNLCRNPIPEKWVDGVDIAKADILSKGIWTPQYPGRLDSGYWINQMYSCVNSPVMLAHKYLLGLSNQAWEQDFWNSKIGIGHVVAGARLTDIDLEACRGDYLMTDAAHNSDVIRTLGVDVGKKLHYEVTEWPMLNGRHEPRIIAVGEVSHFEQLDLLMERFRITRAVVDANPESRKALEFAERFRGHVFVCYYIRNTHGRHFVVNDMTMQVNVNRTNTLDVSMGRFKVGRIRIPKNTPYDYPDQLKAPARHYKKDSQGNFVAVYSEGSKPDHYAHARNYSEIAFTTLVYQGSAEDIRENIYAN